MLWMMVAGAASCAGTSQLFFSHSANEDVSAERQYIKEELIITQAPCPMGTSLLVAIKKDTHGDTFVL